MDLQRASQTIDYVAQQYARRSYSIEKAELIQEGWRIALEASVAWHCATEDQLQNTLRVTLFRHLSRFLHRMTTPVSFHRPECIGRAARSPIDSDDPSFANDMQDDCSPEIAFIRYQAAMLAADARSELRARFFQIWQNRKPSLAPAVAEVLLENKRPSMCATPDCVTSDELYDAIAYGKRKLLTDPVSLRLLDTIHQEHTE